MRLLVVHRHSNGSYRLRHSEWKSQFMVIFQQMNQFLLNLGAQPPHIVKTMKNYLFFLCKHSSSIIGRCSYIGFFIDWLFGLLSLSSSFLIVILSASITIGIYLYINGMVDDIKVKMKLIDDICPIRPTQLPHLGEGYAQRSVQQNIWAIYVEEIRFHLEIIG